jgi:hypothetical protein
MNEILERPEPERGGRAVRVQNNSVLHIVTDTDPENVSRSGGDANPQADKISTEESEELIGFEEAARILGMGQRNLRKIIQRSRERIEGRWTSGPVIRFFQSHLKAAIKFRRKWLDDFIHEYTHDPNSPSLLPPEPHRRKTKEHETVGFGSQGGISEPLLGFDSSLYDF